MNRRRKRIVWAAIAVLVLILVGGVLLMRPIISKVISRVRSYIPLPVYQEPVESDGTYTNVIFLHHSTGRLLIEEGNVRPLFTERGYQFWDHGYNNNGLVRPDGTPTRASYRIPGFRGRGNTDVDGLAALFSEPVTDPPSNAFSRLLQHEVIIVKSCFPNSAIDSDEMQAQFQSWYLQMRDVVDQHPDRIFIILTSPPLHPLVTDREQGARARFIANWLTSDTYLGGRSNLFVMDFFDMLADPETNMLRASYQRDPNKGDSHPNPAANRAIGPQFVDFCIASIESYRALQQ